MAYTPILQANLLTQLVLMGAAALMALPAPLASPPALHILLLVLGGVSVLSGWPRRLVRLARGGAGGVP